MWTRLIHYLVEEATAEGGGESEETGGTNGIDSSVQEGTGASGVDTDVEG